MLHFLLDVWEQKQTSVQLQIKENDFLSRLLEIIQQQ